MFQAFKDKAKRFKDRVNELLFYEEKVTAGLLTAGVLLSAVWAYAEGQSVLKMMEAKRNQQVQQQIQEVSQIKSMESILKIQDTAKDNNTVLKRR